MSRLDSVARMRRLLELIPWVVAHRGDGGPTVAATCARFAMTERDLESDLSLLYVCGLYPYTPDMLMEAEIVDGRVRIQYGDYLAAPTRLRPAEGLALLASARSLLDTPGTDPDGPLARGLTKLAATMGARDDTVRVDAPLVDPAIVTALRDSAEARQQVRIDYYAFGRNERRVRVIEPSDVFTRTGQWYVSAFCTDVADDRVFRVDRIVELERLDGLASGPRAPKSPELFSRSALGQARVRLQPNAAWVATQYPVHHVEELADAALEVVLPVQAEAWLDRLLLRLGPDAELMEPPQGYRGVAVAAAAIVRRHEPLGPVSPAAADLNRV